MSCKHATKEKDISVIQNYMNQHFFEPAYNWPTYWFEGRAYSRWVANEILRLLKEQGSTPTIDIIKEFILKLDEWSCMNEGTSRIFSIAREAAEDILYLFMPDPRVPF